MKDSKKELLEELLRDVLTDLKKKDQKEVKTIFTDLFDDIIRVTKAKESGECPYKEECDSLEEVIGRCEDCPYSEEEDPCQKACEDSCKDFSETPETIISSIDDYASKTDSCCLRSLITRKREEYLEEAYRSEVAAEVCLDLLEELSCDTEPVDDSCSD